MLHAGLRRVTDRWAVAVTAIGSVGSIALNVAGVIGTRLIGTVPLLDFVVAAVPPTAAMLAFGLLMRQIHQLVDDSTAHPVPVPDDIRRSPNRLLAPVVTTSVQPSKPPTESTQEREPLAIDSVQEPEPPSPVTERPSRGGRPPNATIEELAEIGRAAAFEHGRLSRAILRKAVADKGLTIGSGRMTEVMKILRPEVEDTKTTASTGG